MAVIVGYALIALRDRPDRSWLTEATRQKPTSHRPDVDHRVSGTATPHRESLPANGFDVRVLDKHSRMAISGAEVWVGTPGIRVITEEQCRMIGTTDQFGALRIGAAEVASFRAADGYVTVAATYDEYASAFARVAPESRDRLLELERAQSFVVDCVLYDGQPLPGAHVFVSTTAFPFDPPLLDDVTKSSGLPAFSRRAVTHAVADEVGVADLGPLPPGDYIAFAYHESYITTDDGFMGDSLLHVPGPRMRCRFAPVVVAGISLPRGSYIRRSISSALSLTIPQISLGVIQSVGQRLKALGKLDGYDTYWSVRVPRDGRFDAADRLVATARIVRLDGSEFFEDAAYELLADGTPEPVVIQIDPTPDERIARAHVTVLGPRNEAIPGIRFELHPALAGADREHDARILTGRESAYSMLSGDPPRPVPPGLYIATVDSTTCGVQLQSDAVRASAGAVLNIVVPCPTDLLECRLTIEGEGRELPVNMLCSIRTLADKRVCGIATSNHLAPVTLWLQPGEYRARLRVAGFQAVELPWHVIAGTPSSQRLEVRLSSE